MQTKGSVWNGLGTQERMNTDYQHRQHSEVPLSVQSLSQQGRDMVKGKLVNPKDLEWMDQL